MCDPVWPNTFSTMYCILEKPWSILQNRTVDHSPCTQQPISWTNINRHWIGLKKICTACIRSTFWHFVSLLHLMISTNKDKNRGILFLLSRIFFYHYEYVNVRNQTLALLMKHLCLSYSCSLETSHKPCKESSQWKLMINQITVNHDDARQIRLWYNSELQLPQKTSVNAIIPMWVKMIYSEHWWTAMISL